MIWNAQAVLTFVLASESQYSMSTQGGGISLPAAARMAMSTQLRQVAVVAPGLPDWTFESK